MIFYTQGVFNLSSLKKFFQAFLQLPNSYIIVVSTCTIWHMVPTFYYVLLSSQYAAVTKKRIVN